MCTMNSNKSSIKLKQICPRCSGTGSISVHGHVACTMCGIYLVECCDGEQANPNNKRYDNEKTTNQNQ